MKTLYLSVAALALGSTIAHAETPSDYFRTAPDAMEMYASDFIGMHVYRADPVADDTAYDTVRDDWDDVGKINDVILSRDGTVDAVLIDIGGFLGIGGHQVAVNMDAINFVPDGDTADDESDYFIVLDVPRATLEESPVYEWHNADMDDQMAPTDDQMADVAPDATGSTTSDMTSDAVDTVPPVMTDHTPIMREGYALVRPDTVTSEMLTGATVYDANDDSIGDVSDLVISDDNKIDAVVVNVGGFLGIGAKPVALRIADVDILQPTDGGSVRIYVSLTRDEMEALPVYEQ